MNYNPLEIIEQHWRNYLLSTDAVKSLKKQLSRISRESLFEPEESYNIWYEKYLKDSKEYIIILLWAIFEQIIIDYLKKEVPILTRKEPRFKAVIEHYATKKIHNWKTEFRIDLIKSRVTTDDVKQVYRYRNYLVHRNPEYNYSSLPPEEVYKRIKKAVIALYPYQPLPDELFL